jgi:hypothetical protein
VHSPSHRLQVIRVIKDGHTLTEDDLDGAIIGGGEPQVNIVSKLGECVTVVDNEGTLAFRKCDAGTQGQVWRMVRFDHAFHGVKVNRKAQWGVQR